ncbi:MAG: ribonuclease HIII [Deltaproteobacteria bacterium]|nr:ribonuclease HIII [Deltaproteobacteria bacterium]
MKQQLGEWLEEARKIIEEAGFVLEKTREIQYGIQWLVSREGTSFPVNIYHSKKRGITVVCGGKCDSAARVELERMLGAVKTKESTTEDLLEMPFASWVGTDEAGKGDYFGPLVVAGFVADRAIAPVLTEMGIRDSKSMNNARVTALGRDIQRRFGDRVEVVEIPPHRYNRVIEQFRKEGKNLNHLLGWAHARVVENLMKRRPFEAALADRFGDEKYIREALRSMKRVDLWQVPRAERNPAVAAASVVARHRFLMGLKNLEKEAGREIPRGAGDEVMTAARAICLQGGMERLARVAKLHFSITKRLK